MALRVNLPERCLLYLLDRAGARGDDSDAEKLAQASIAEALHARQAHVSRAMRRVCARGCAKIVKIHVRGRGKRRLAYMLTSKGLREAKEQRQRLEDAIVNVIDLEGSEKEIRLREVYALLPRRPRISDLITNLEDGRLDLRRFVAWQGRMYGGKVYDVREAITVPHFTGRAEAVSRLDEFMGEPKARGFLLVGLPGVGKTAVASKWVDSLRGRVHVFWRNVRRDMEARDMLSDLADMLQSVGRPALSEYLGRPSEDGRDFSLDLLKRDLTGLRVLLVLDNAHLGREGVAGLVTGILNLEPAPDSPKVLLLARERVPFCTAEDKALGRVRELELTDLPHSEASAMLKAMGVSDDRRDVILERCGGNPLSLELAASGAMPLEAIKRTSADRLMQDVLSRLSPEVRDTLAFAAMFEGAVPLDLLGGHASELLRLCVLREEESGVGSMHDIVREAALRDIPPDRLIKLHVSAGDFYARSHDPGDILRAVRHFVASAADEEAQELVADRGQDIIDAGLAGSLLSLLDRLAWTARDSRLGNRVTLLHGNALFALGRWVEAAREYEKCSSASDPSMAAEAMLGRGKAEVQRRSPLALQHLTAAQEQLERMGSLRLLAEAQYWIGGVHEDAGRLDEARDAFEKGRAIAFSMGDRRWEGLCRYGIARVHHLQTDEAKAAEEAMEALRLLEREGYRLDIAKVCAALGGALMALGRKDEADSFIVRAVNEARATGAVGVLASSLYNLASLKQVTDRMEEAVPLLEEALGLFEQLEKYDEAAWCAAWIASEDWLAGRVERGDLYASHANQLISRTTEPTLRVRALRNFARAAMRAGRKGDASLHLKQAIAEARAAGLEKSSADPANERESIG
jgi:tetratricopeptide (TPR) repeat protein/DNA-binding MarR family transcriptional regulator